MNSSPTRREIRIAVALSAALLFFAVILPAAYRNPRLADFSGQYSAGVIVRAGNASKLYDLREQRRVQEDLFERKGLLVYAYPPFEVLPFVLLAGLPYRAAYLLWGGLNVLLWFLFQQLARKNAGTGVQPLRFLMLASLFFPLWVALLQGQISVLLLVAMTLTFVCLQHRREFAAGSALGLGLLKFQVVLPFALIFLLRGRWRVVSGILAVAGILGLISLSLVGPSGMLSYAKLLIDISGHASNPVYSIIKPWNMPTVRGFMIGVLGGRIPQFLTKLLGAAGSALLICVAAWEWHHNEGTCEDLGLVFSAALTVSLLSTPYLQPHDLTPMLLAILLVVSSSKWTARSTERLLLISVIAILYASPLYLSFLIKRGLFFLLAPVLLVFALAAFSLGRRNLGLSAGLRGAEGETPQMAGSTRVTS